MIETAKRFFSVVVETYIRPSMFASFRDSIWAKMSGICCMNIMTSSHAFWLDPVWFTFSVSHSIDALVRCPSREFCGRKMITLCLIAFWLEYASPTNFTEASWYHAEEATTVGKYGALLSCWRIMENHAYDCAVDIKTWMSSARWEFHPKHKYFFVSIKSFPPVENRTYSKRNESSISHYVYSIVAHWLSIRPYP